MNQLVLIAALLLPVPLLAQGTPKDAVLEATSDIQKAVEGTDQMRLRVNRYCHVTITHEPEEALLRVISTHILSQKYDVPASEMLYVIRAGVATEGQLLLWSGDCAETGARAEDQTVAHEAYRLASQLVDFHQRLHKANEHFWDLLATRIAVEERTTLPEQ